MRGASLNKIRDREWTIETDESGEWLWYKGATMSASDTHESMDIPKYTKGDQLPSYDCEEARVQAINECGHPGDMLRHDPDAPMPGGAVLCLQCGDAV